MYYYIGLWPGLGGDRKILKPETLDQDSAVHARVKARGNFVIINKKYFIFIIIDSFTVTTNY